MTIVKFKPYGDLLSIHNKINRLFEGVYRDGEHDHESLATWSPSTDIIETKDDYIFKIEVPGLSREDINIEMHNNTLTVKGEKKAEKEINKEKFHRIESYSGSFSRSFTLPKQVDPNKIVANLKNGILELRIIKAEDKKSKSIPIFTE